MHRIVNDAPEGNGMTAPDGIATARRRWAVLVPTSLGRARAACPPRQRGTAVGVWAGVGAIAAGSGPVLGGLLIGSSWRWIFLINVPIVLAALAAGVAILPRRGGARERR